MPPMASSSKQQVEDVPLDAERADAAARKARRATRLFKVGTELAFKAPTFCETMRNIVGLREAVWLQQREFVERDNLQIQSRKVADKLCASSANIVLRANFAAYERFCAIADAPVFPITHAMLALAMCARCTAEDGRFRTFRDDILRVKSVTASIWSKERQATEMDKMDPDGAGLLEFMQEDVRRDNPASKKRKRGMKTGGASASSRSATTDNKEGLDTGYASASTDCSDGRPAGASNALCRTSPSCAGAALSKGKKREATEEPGKQDVAAKRIRAEESESALACVTPAHILTTENPLEQSLTFSSTFPPSSPFGRTRIIYTSPVSIAQLAAFLSLGGPTLINLAGPLHAAGFDTLDSLSYLKYLSPGVLTCMLDVVALGAQVDNGLDLTDELEVFSQRIAEWRNS